MQARKSLMNFFEEMIKSRRSSNECHEDFLQSMLDRDPLDDERLDDAEIMDNMLTLIIAGQTTTAAAMMWSVKFLDENKEAQNMLRVSTNTQLIIKINILHPKMITKQ
ncbi:putative (+)-abscisic acid 8'-hydroxylase [Helianthus anomalus]